MSNGSIFVQAQEYYYVHPIYCRQCEGNIDMSMTRYYMLILINIVPGASLSSFLRTKVTHKNLLHGEREPRKEATLFSEAHRNAKYTQCNGL